MIATQQAMYATKECSRCRNILPLDSFYRSRGRGDGRDCYCSDCRRGIQKSPRLKAQLRRVSARHRERHPEKEWARHVADRAIVSGKLAKLPCQFKGCGSLDVQAHHDDYSKPLDVIWLCRKHHHEHHLTEKERSA